MHDARAARRTGGRTGARWAAVALGVALLLVAPRGDRAVSGSAPAPTAGTPCAIPAVPAASPAAADTSEAATGAAGAPIVREGLTVAFLPETTEARPNDLTVMVCDGACAPVNLAVR